jgi:hypothetical protein
MSAEYDVSTKTESVRRHKKIILDETFSAGFDKLKMKKRLLKVIIYYYVFFTLKRKFKHLKCLVKTT